MKAKKTMPVDTEIENTTNEIKLTDIQQEAYEKADKELQEFNKEIETKKYLIDLTKDEGTILLNFIVNDANWKFTESLGINEVIKNLQETIKKSGSVLLTGTAIEAIYFYLSKVEGVGQKVNSSSIKTVDVYLKLLKALNITRNKVAVDVEKQKQLEYISVCRAEGVEPSI